MGVDAEMFVRVRRPLTPKKVQRLAYEIASAFGPKSFFVSKEHGRCDHCSRVREARNLIVQAYYDCVFFYCKEPCI